MGACLSENETADEKKRKADEKERSRAIEKVMSKGHANDQQINKLLLLGAGESGKSTLFKQMITIYGKGYPEAERKTFTPIIYNNVITAMKILCHHAPSYQEVAVENGKCKAFIEEAASDIVINPTVAGNIKALWADDGIQETYKKSCKVPIDRFSKLFFQES